MRYRKQASLAVLLFVLLCFPMSALAEESDPIGFRTDLSVSDMKAGEQGELTVSLTGYTDEVSKTDPIRGIQTDIGNVDEQILTVKKSRSLLDGQGALSNQVTYHNVQKRIRFLYVQEKQVLSGSVAELFQVSFQISDQVKEDGEIRLPVTMKIQTASKQITLSGEILITYSANVTAVSTVEIYWGAMDFQYQEGQWNPETHIYENAKWEDGNSGFITVKNTGTETVKTVFTYQTARSDLTGMFWNQESEIRQPVRIEPQTSQQIFLRIFGKPAEEMNRKTIGSVTVGIVE